MAKETTLQCTGEKEKPQGTALVKKALTIVLELIEDMNLDLKAGPQGLIFFFKKFQPSYCR